MAFIKEKERKSLIAKINQSYGFRKFLITLEIVGLIGFIIVIFLNGSGLLTGNKTVIPFVENSKLTGFGIGMLIYAILLALFGIIALILTFTIKSPKTVKAEMNKLQSSALSGKRVKATDTNVETNRERTTVKKTSK